MCPLVEHAPMTAEGSAALAALMHPATWLRAGLTGVVVGVDLEAGLKRIDPAGLDLELVRLIAVRGEAGLMEGIVAAMPTKGNA